MDRPPAKPNLVLRASAVFFAILMIGGYVVMAQMRARPNLVDPKKDPGSSPNSSSPQGDTAELQGNNIAPNFQPKPPPMALSGSKSLVLDFSSAAKPEISLPTGPDITGRQRNSIPLAAQSTSAMGSSKSGVLSFPVKILEPESKSSSSAIPDAHALLGRGDLQPGNSARENQSSRVVVSGSGGRVTLDTTAVEQPRPREIEIQMNKGGPRAKVQYPPPLVIVESPSTVPSASLQTPTLMLVPATPVPRALP